MIRTKLITIGVVAALLAICSATQANQWEHQSSPWQEVPDPGWALNYPTGMAWVLGPDGSTIRSPVETPQPTELTWSIVPGGVAHWLDPTRLTRPMTDLDAFGLSTFADYRDALEGVVNEWASACGIINAGYVHEDGTVLVGDVPDTDADGNHTITDRGFTAGVGHIRFMAYDQDGLDGASSSGQATYIPEPGSAVDNAYNRRKAGDVRLRSDADIFGDEGLTGGGAGYYFRRIAMHEMGHTLGFGHNTVSDSVMGEVRLVNLVWAKEISKARLRSMAPYPEISMKMAAMTLPTLPYLHYRGWRTLTMAIGTRPAIFPTRTIMSSIQKTSMSSATTGWRVNSCYLTAITLYKVKVFTNSSI